MSAQVEWRVLPHGPLQRLSGRVHRVEGKLESGPPLTRVMTVAQMADRKLVIHSPIAMAETEMAALEALGPVGYIIVPNHWHRLDAPRFASRYPDARVLCPSGSRKKVEEVVRVDGTTSDFPADPHVHFEPIDGIAEIEAAMVVRDEDGLTLVLTDAVFNMPHRAGIAGFILRHVTGSSGGPRVSRLIKHFLIKDRARFRASLERFAALPDLKRVIVAHHETIERDPSRVLREIAQSL